MNGKMMYECECCHQMFDNIKDCHEHEIGCGVQEITANKDYALANKGRWVRNKYNEYFKIPENPDMDNSSDCMMEYYVYECNGDLQIRMHDSVGWLSLCAEKHPVVSEDEVREFIHDYLKKHGLDLEAKQ